MDQEPVYSADISKVQYVRSILDCVMPFTKEMINVHCPVTL